MALLTACSSPAHLYNVAAEDRSYIVRGVPADPFLLTAYITSDAQQPTQLWHIYLTGDGTPWERGRYKSSDPTPRHPMALRLMDRDPAPRLLLHRPCYGRLQPSIACQPSLWTERRYSEQVVRAMDQALDRLVTELSIEGMVLIGYSGGGTLARLLAGRRGDVRALITIAANLDHEAWANYHGYLLLEGSLRISDTAPMAQQVLQWHLAGSRDTVVPASIVQLGARHDPHAHVEVIEGLDHSCWAEHWPQLLESLNRRIRESEPNSRAGH